MPNPLLVGQALPPANRVAHALVRAASTLVSTPCRTGLLACHSPRGRNPVTHAA